MCSQADRVNEDDLSGICGTTLLVAMTLLCVLFHEVLGVVVRLAVTSGAVFTALVVGYLGVQFVTSHWQR